MDAATSKLIQELRNLKSRIERIDAVLEDLNGGAQKYEKIDPWDLADMLELNTEDGAEVSASHSVSGKVSLIDMYGGDPTPIADHIEIIYNSSEPERVKLWRQQVNEIISGEREEDITISPSELERLEKAMTVKEINDGGGWVVRELRIAGSKGLNLNFQVCIGDAGVSFDLLGPYELARGETHLSDDVVIAESF